MIKTDTLSEAGLHVFERAGLGRAPFRCIGMQEKVYQAAQGLPVQPAGTCDYCGQGIRYVYIVKDRAGKTFGVGCDCVARTGDAGLIRSYKTLPEVRAANRAKAANKDARVSQEFDVLMADPANIAKLQSTMVAGRPWVPGDMVPAYDNFKRLWAMCGASGRARTLKALKTMLTKGE